MCHVLLLSLTCWLTFTLTQCDLEQDLSDPSVIVQKAQDGGSAKTSGGSEYPQTETAWRWQKKWLWTRKRSHSSSEALDDPDMRGWLHSGRPNISFKYIYYPREKVCTSCSSHDTTLRSSPGTQIRLVFLDVYLLPGSHLSIDQAETQPPDGSQSVTRFSAQSITNELHIIIHQPQSKATLKWFEQPSYTAMYWEIPSTEDIWKRRPWTQCPAVSSAVIGGKVSLPDSGPVLANLYIYDCVWVVRVTWTEWGVYVRVTDMDLGSGLLEVRHGLNYSGDLLASNSNGSDLASLKQPAMGFLGQSKGGLYVRVVKPINDGHITFVYGVWSPLHTDTRSCWFEYQGHDLMKGWGCRDPLMCIPFNNTCNGIENCPDGSDEEKALCHETTQEPTVCPEESHKQCPNGECVHKTLQLCPEEKCPEERPFRCDFLGNLVTKCYSQLERCNGFQYCRDNKDERGCPKSKSGLSTKTIVIIVCVSGLFTILPSIILCCWDDPMERDMRRAQQAFNNMCDIYSGRTLLTQIQAARRTAAVSVEHDGRPELRPTYPRGTVQEEVILLGPTDGVEPQPPATRNNMLVVPAVETLSPRRPTPRPIISTTPPLSRSPSSETNPSCGQPSPPDQSPPELHPSMLAPPPYLLQPDVAALEHPPLTEEGSTAPPPYLLLPGGATADGLPPDSEAPPPYEVMQHVQSPDASVVHLPVYKEWKASR